MVHKHAKILKDLSVELTLWQRIKLWFWCIKLKLWLKWNWSMKLHLFMLTWRYIIKCDKSDYKVYRFDKLKPWKGWQDTGARFV